MKKKAELELQCRRGGKRQRMAALEEMRQSGIPVPGSQSEGTQSASASASASTGASEGDRFDSRQGRDFLRKYTSGRLSAAEVQRSAALAYDDQQELLAKVGGNADHASQTLQKLAGLGASGRHPKNCNAELKTYLGEPAAPKPLEVEIECKKARRGLTMKYISMVALPFLLPHLMFSFLFSSRHELFVERFLGPGGSTQTLVDFWMQVERLKDPRLEGHPMQKRSAWREKAIPLQLHGDGVPVTAVGRATAESLDAVAWNSLFALHARAKFNRQHRNISFRIYCVSIVTKLKHFI